MAIYADALSQDISDAHDLVHDAWLMLRDALEANEESSSEDKEATAKEAIRIAVELIDEAKSKIQD